MALILLVDDDVALCRTIGLVLGARGHEIRIVASGEHAIEAVRTTRPDAAIIDVHLPGGIDGLETFKALRGIDPNLAGVFLTGSGSIRMAVAATHAGAFDYLTKPFDNEELCATIDRAVEFRGLRDEVALRAECPEIVCRSRAMADVLHMVSRVAATDATVLITGESGTGKELVARAIHRRSQRADAAFIAVNCAAIPATLVESEFFGHERGAFTDAQTRRIGRFEQANRGTLFLDEIGELPLDAQAKILRVLEAGVVTRVGGHEEVRVDVRVVAATNRDLARSVASGHFRQDLYWRIHVLPLPLPPLRDRPDDVPLLVRHLLTRLNVELARGVSGVTPDAMARLTSHRWPGNVRELENVLRRAVILSDGITIGVSDIRLSTPGESNPPGSEVQMTLAQAVSRAGERVERQMIEAALARHRGNRTATATALGIDRKTLFYKLKLYGLSSPTAVDEDFA